MLINAPKVIMHGYYVGIILVMIYGYFLIKLRYLYASISGLIMIVINLLVDHYYLNMPDIKSFSKKALVITSLKKNRY